MAKVETVLDPAIEARGFETIRSTVEVDLVDGRTLVQDADERYRGGPERPFTRDELHEKFSDCASLVLAAGRCDRRCSRPSSPSRTMADVGELVELLTRTPVASR